MYKHETPSLQMWHRKNPQTIRQKVAVGGPEVQLHTLLLKKPPDIKELREYLSFTVLSIQTSF